VFPENKITRNRPKKSTSPTLHEKVARLEKEVIGIKDAQSNGVTVYAVDVDSLKPGESLYVMDDAGEKKLLSRIGRVKIEDEVCKIPRTCHIDAELVCNRMMRQFLQKHQDSLITKARTKTSPLFHSCFPCSRP
jgi:hypothetical protein